MADLLAISQVLTSLKAAKDIATAAMELRDSTAFIVEVGKLNAQIVDAMNSIFAIQQDRATLVDRVERLEKQIIQMEDWEAEKARYEMKAVPGSAVIAYCVKEDEDIGEPAHWLCPTCYQRAKKSILQPETRFPGRSSVLVCHECKAELYVSGARQM